MSFFVALREMFCRSGIMVDMAMCYPAGSVRLGCCGSCAPIYPLVSAKAGFCQFLHGQLDSKASTEVTGVKKLGPVAFSWLKGEKQE